MDIELLKIVTCAITLNEGGKVVISDKFKCVDDYLNENYSQFRRKEILGHAYEMVKSLREENNALDIIRTNSYHIIFNFINYVVRDNLLANIPLQRFFNRIDDNIPPLFEFANLRENSHFSFLQLSICELSASRCNSISFDTKDLMPRRKITAMLNLNCKGEVRFCNDAYVILKIYKLTPFSLIFISPNCTKVHYMLKEGNESNYLVYFN
jgi:hypothetical protein